MICQRHSDAVAELFAGKRRIDFEAQFAGSDNFEVIFILRAPLISDACLAVNKKANRRPGLVPT